MDLETIERMLFAKQCPLFTSDYLEMTFFHQKDVLLRVSEIRDVPEGRILEEDFEEQLDHLGDVEWDVVFIVISYANLPLGSFTAVDLRSLDDEFGATIPVPLAGDICPIAWAVSRSISSAKPFAGFTGDLGLAPGNKISTWDRWVGDEVNNYPGV